MPTPNLTPVPQTVAAFRNRLRRLPLRSWLEAGRRLADSDSEAVCAAMQSARRRLRQVVEVSPEGATRVRRNIHELVAVAEGMVHRTDIQLMKKAALTAALALSTRNLLDPQDFALLYGPFEGFIPLAEVDPAAG